MSAESIWKKPLTKRQKEGIDRLAKEQQSGEAGPIDYSDVPALTDKPLAQFRRHPKKLVAVRLDADVV